MTEGEGNDVFEGITTDYGWTQGKARTFQAHAKTMHRLGCDDFDKFAKIVELKFPKHERAYRKFSKELHTNKKEVIEATIKRNILYEVIGI